MPRFGQRLPPPCAYPLSQDIWSLDRKWPSLRSSSIPTDPRNNPPEVINWNTPGKSVGPSWISTAQPGIDYLCLRALENCARISHNLDPKNSGTLNLRAVGWIPAAAVQQGRHPRCTAACHPMWHGIEVPDWNLAINSWKHGVIFGAHVKFHCFKLQNADVATMICSKPFFGPQKYSEAIYEWDAG